MSNDCARFQPVDELSNNILHFHIQGVCFVTNRVAHVRERVCVGSSNMRGPEGVPSHNVCISSHTRPSNRAQPGRTRDRNTICDNHTTTISSAYLFPRFPTKKSKHVFCVSVPFLPQIPANRHTKFPRFISDTTPGPRTTTEKSWILQQSVLDHLFITIRSASQV